MRTVENILRSETFIHGTDLGAIHGITTVVLSVEMNGTIIAVLTLKLFKSVDSVFPCHA